MSATGLKQKIFLATSEEEARELMNTGETYEFASSTTRRTWKRAFARRLNLLKGTPLPVQIEEVVEEVEIKKKGKKKKKVGAA